MGTATLPASDQKRGCTGHVGGAGERGPCSLSPGAQFMPLGTETRVGSLQSIRTGLPQRVLWVVPMVRPQPQAEIQAACPWHRLAVRRAGLNWFSVPGAPFQAPARPSLTVTGVGTLGVLHIGRGWRTVFRWVGVLSCLGLRLPAGLISPLFPP